jgi:hypothetical protein
MNGLVLTPAANFSIAGPNQLNLNTTLVHAASGTHILRVYKWTNPLNVFQGEIGFYYNDAELNGLTEAFLILQLHNGINWTPFTTGLVRNTGSNLVRTTVNNYTLEECTLTDQLTILPLVWGAITASRVQDKAYVKWTAYGVKAGDHFIVERSSDGVHWKAVAAPVQAYAGEEHYTVEDRDAPAGKTFYRVQLVQANSESGSWSRMAMIPAVQVNQVAIYPNPVKDIITVQSSANGIRQINMYSSTGRLVYSASPGGVSFSSFNTATLAPGYYLLQLVLADHTLTSFPIIKK